MKRATRAQVKYNGHCWIASVWFDNGDEFHEISRFNGPDPASILACRHDSGRIPAGIVNWERVHGHFFRWSHIPTTFLVAHLERPVTL